MRSDERQDSGVDIVVALVLLVPLALLQGAAVNVMWKWFVTSWLGVEAPGIVRAACLTSLVSIAIGPSRLLNVDGPTWVKMIVWTVITWCIVALCWVLKMCGGL